MRVRLSRYVTGEYTQTGKLVRTVGETSSRRNAASLDRSGTLTTTGPISPLAIGGPGAVEEGRVCSRESRLVEGQLLRGGLDLSRVVPGPHGNRCFRGGCGPAWTILDNGPYVPVAIRLGGRLDGKRRRDQ